MNKIKIYLRTKSNIEEQAKLYAEVFEGEILKNSFMHDSQEWSYAYLNLFNNVNIMIAKHYKNMPEWGYSSDFVFSLEDKKLFKSILNNMKKSKSFIMDYDETKYEWGTTIAKFIDKFGYGWIIETQN